MEDVLSVMTPLEWTVEDSEKSAEIHLTLSKLGKTLNVKDILIAGQCIQREIPIVSRNIAHFKRIAGLKVIDGNELA